MATTQLPSLGDLLLPLLQRVPVDHQPLFIAVAERAAAERYRNWGTEVHSSSVRSSLLACADRETQIAVLIESMYPDAASIQRNLTSSVPELTDTTFFAQFSLRDQFAIQAEGERLGAQTWRSFASETKDGRARSIFLQCAGLEEENATALEATAGQTL